MEYNRTIVFDMDGTIADFYGVDGWLDYLKAENTTPYEEYNDRTRKAKLEWLARHNFPYDEIHLVKYGTTKANCTRKIGGYQVLVDDNENVRKGWTLGHTINANNDITKELKKLVNFA